MKQLVSVLIIVLVAGVSICVGISVGKLSTIKPLQTPAVSQQPSQQPPPQQPPLSQQPIGTAVDFENHRYIYVLGGGIVHAESCTNHTTIRVLE